MRVRTAIADLIERGVSFDRRADGTLMMGREAGHDTRRILHADGDATGAEIARALAVAARAAEHIEIIENAFAVDLVVDCRPSGRSDRQDRCRRPSC